MTMKPGSSNRCGVKAGVLRCHRTKGHSGQHQAPQGNATVKW